MSAALSAERDERGAIRLPGQHFGTFAVAIATRLPLCLCGGRRFAFPPYGFSGFAGFSSRFSDPHVC
jgi:hypothetical protein